MNDPHGEERLRARFQELRDSTERAGKLPEFGAVRARAEAAVAARPALEVVAGAPVQGRRRWVVVGAWGSAAMAAAVAGLLLVRPAPNPDEEFARLVTAYATESAAGTWRSPTSALLAVPGMELTRSVPTIGVTVPGLEQASPEPGRGAGPRDDA